MTTVVRLAKAIVLLLLALFCVMLVVGLATPETGTAEKVVLLALFAGCLFLAARVPTLATKAAARLQRR